MDAAEVHYFNKHAFVNKNSHSKEYFLSRSLKELHFECHDVSGCTEVKRIRIATHPRSHCTATAHCMPRAD